MLPPSLSSGGLLDCDHLETLYSSTTSFIFWRAMHRKLSTDDNLRQQGCVIVSVCILCLSTAESTEHLFLSCPFALTIWLWLEDHFCCLIDRSTMHNLLFGVSAYCSSQVQDVSIVAVLHRVHAIWLLRNALRFSPDQFSLHTSKTKIIASIALSCNTSSRKCLSSDTRILDVFLVSPNHRQMRNVIPVVWKMPTLPYIKLNRDGSLIDYMKACGGIFRDCNDSFLGCFAANLGPRPVFEAELHDFIIGLENALQRGWFHVWVEGDSTSTLLAFKKPLFVPFRLRNRWHNCLHAGIHILSSHIYRKGNACADKLSRQGHVITINFLVGFLTWFPKARFFQGQTWSFKYSFPLVCSLFCLHF